MIAAHDLAFAYPGLPPALGGVSFSLAAGKTLGLVGTNGSGKSTLLALLAGLLSPDSGRLTLAGQSSPGQEKALRARVGLVMQDADLQIIGATVGEDLLLGQKGEAGEGGAPPAAQALARAYGLEGLWERSVHELSWGQKKRLCLAAALLRGPSVLLLDEPFAGLDYPAIRQMRASLAANRQAGLTQVVAAHDLEPLADLVDQWLVLEGGRVALAGRGEPSTPPGRTGAAPCSWQAGRGIVPWH